MASNVANYAFQILAGRWLSVEEYGLLASFMAALTIIAVSATALQTTAARAIAAGENQPSHSLFNDHLIRSSVLYALVLGSLIALSVPVSGRFINIGSLPIFFLGLYVVPAALDSLAAGRLQGSKRFVALATYGLGQSLGKLSVTLLVLVLGYHVVGIVGALVLSSTSVALAGLIATRRLGAIQTHVFSPEVRRNFAAVFAFWVLISIDVAFARAFFDPEDAGIYAAAAVLGKAVLLLPAVLIQVVFPHLTEQFTHGRRVVRVVGRALALTLCLTVGATLALFLLGGPLITHLYSERYQAAAPICWMVGAAMIPFAVVNLLLYHFLARRQARFLFAMAAAVIAEITAFTLVPKTGPAYALTLGLVGMGLLVAVFPKTNPKRHLREVFGRALRHEGAQGAGRATSSPSSTSAPHISHSRGSHR
ncbi:lipopolysaccharide biosynthesis protein [Nocardioides gansuensis]|nr:oligosaccharide flippase family protein [Nocardioides gansuensis]